MCVRERESEREGEGEGEGGVQFALEGEAHDRAAPQFAAEVIEWGFYNSLYTQTHDEFRLHQSAEWNQIVFFIALICSSSRRISASASPNQGSEQGDQVPSRRLRGLTVFVLGIVERSSDPEHIRRCSTAGRNPIRTSIL